MLFPIISFIFAIIMQLHALTVPNNVRTLASHTMPLGDRYQVQSVNTVFKNNILLNLAYLDGKVKNAVNLNWNTVTAPTKYTLVLHPNDVFAFHDDVLPQYQGKIVKTTNAHFNASDGFQSDGYLTGDGVCHFASLLYWVAKDAGLKTLAPTNHDFAHIPDVPKAYGAAIFYNPGDHATNSAQNVYIENNLKKNISLEFAYNGSDLTVSVVE